MASQASQIALELGKEAFRVLAVGTTSAYVMKKIDKKADERNFTAERETAEVTAESIKKQIASLDRELMVAYPSGMSEEESVAYWSARSVEAQAFARRIGALQAMADKGSEACAAVLNHAQERAAHWRLTNWLHEKGICVVL